MNEDTTRIVDLTELTGFSGWLWIKFARFAETAEQVIDGSRRSFASVEDMCQGMLGLKYVLVQTAMDRESDDFSTSILFKHHDRSLMCMIRHSSESNRYAIRVAGSNVVSALDAIYALLPPCEIEEGLPEIAFWSMTGHGPQARYRKLSAPAWDDVRHNYSERPAKALGGLMGIKPVDITGRLLIWNGPPGTGKTSAIRTLLNEWGGWCESHYLLDPETFFDSANYMMAVALGNENGSPSVYSDDSKRRRREWKLVVVEDADEFLTRDAKDRSGQGMARLLNITDGLPGQGMNLLVLITTNEDVGRLHPAILRPGRCLSHIEFPNLTADESRDWLRLQGAEGWGLVPSEGMSLAELYARVSNVGALSSMEPDRALGFVR